MHRNVLCANNDIKSAPDRNRGFCLERGRRNYTVFLIRIPDSRAKSHMCSTRKKQSRKKEV